MTKLNNQQQKAVQADNRPLLIIAGAGTGKTRTLTSRIIYLMENQKILPEKICALTFTNKAAKEMADRVSAFIKSKAKLPFIGTFHSLGSSILRKEARFLDRKSNFVIFDDNDSFQLIKKLSKNSALKPGTIREKISLIKNLSVNPSEISELGVQGRLILDKFREYEQKLRNNNAFDFDDLIEKTIRVLSENQDILKKYQTKFTHFLIDEYQDINRAQYELVKLLVGNRKNLSAVGDHEQTIYGWRGSDIEMFLNFEKEWPGSQVIFLEENYRSTANIIKAASEIIRNSSYTPPGWKGRKLWTKNPDGPMVRIIEARDADEESKLIADDIKNKLTMGENHLKIAILYRTNAQSRALEQALIEAEISYQIFGGLKFYERREIKDILAGIRCFFNSQDELSKERLLKNLGKRRSDRFWQTIHNNESIGPLKVIDKFLSSTNYLEYINQQLTNPEDRRENIKELIHFASSFNDLGRFLETASLLQATDDMEKTGNPIQLMTIHLAKGLEFDQVFIAGCSEGLIPHRRSMDNSANTEEERRLIYVAMTRAKKELVISFYDLPSRFLIEIPMNVVEFNGQRPIDEEERYITID